MLTPSCSEGHWHFLPSLSLHTLSPLTFPLAQKETMLTSPIITAPQCEHAPGERVRVPTARPASANRLPSAWRPFLLLQIKGYFRLAGLRLHGKFTYGIFATPHAQLYPRPRSSKSLGRDTSFGIFKNKNQKAQEIPKGSAG